MRPLGAKYSPAPWVGNNYTDRVRKTVEKVLQEERR